MVSWCRVHAGGVELDVSRMRPPTNIEQRYGALLDRAVSKIAELEQGAIANRDEGRQVGHNWLRNEQLAPVQFRQPIKLALDRIEKFAPEVFDGHFDTITWIGIGGSAMAPQLLHDALRVPGTTPPMFFFDNTDPAGFARTLAEIELSGGLEKTLVVVVSKSGGTKETRSGMRVIQRSFEQRGLSFESNAVAITQQGSGLDKLAGPPDASDPATVGAQWLARFPIWDWVGGRTSLFSAVGMLPATLGRLGAKDLIAGARAMDDATRGRSLSGNPALLLAAIWYHTVETNAIRNMVLLPYCDRLVLLSKYLQQLIMESLGKNGKGISVFGNKGSTDQHSFVQQLREGYNDFFATFVCVRDPGVDWVVDAACDANLDTWSRPRTEITAGDYLAAFQEGTAEALSEAGRASLQLTVDQLDARTLGALVALFERAVGFYAEMLGINAYHQPGVEAGKVAAERVLDIQSDVVLRLRQGNGEPRSVKELARETGTDPKLVCEILNRLHVCRRHGVTLLDETAKAAVADRQFKAS